MRKILLATAAIALSSSIVSAQEAQEMTGPSSTTIEFSGTNAPWCAVTPDGAPEVALDMETTSDGTSVTNATAKAINVNCNVSWELELQDEDGAEITSLTFTAKDGDDTVSASGGYGNTFQAGVALDNIEGDAGTINPVNVNFTSQHDGSGLVAGTYTNTVVVVANAA